MKIFAEIPESIAEFSIDGVTIINTYDEKGCIKCKEECENEAPNGTIFLKQVE